MTNIYREKNKKWQIWISFDEETPPSMAPYLVEAYLKVKGGIKYLVWRYHSCDVKQIKKDTIQHGYFSRRPYRLAQPCDGSIDSSVHALFYAFCQANNLDARTLYLEAYPDTKKENVNYQEIIEFAEWQGVKYPKKWGEKEFDGLIESLTEINNHSLVGILEEYRPMLDVVI